MSTGEIGGARGGGRMRSAGTGTGDGDRGRDRCGKKIVLFSRIWS